MNKKGFTLSEALITLGIIGVIAAITVPGFVSNRPSENKIKFQKAYTALSSTVADLVDDETLYYRLPNAGGGLVDCEGLVCQGRPLSGSNPFNITNNTEPWQKLAYLIAERMTRTGNPVLQGDQINFTTADGVEWQMRRSPANIDRFPLWVVIDVNNNQNDIDNQDKLYSEMSNNEKTNGNFIPDRCLFVIDRDGAVAPSQGVAGAFERYILRHPSQLNRKAILDDIRDTGHSLDTK